MENFNKSIAGFWTIAIFASIVIVLIVITKVQNDHTKFTPQAYTNTNAQKQLLACRQVINIDQQALELSGQAIALSSEGIDAILNNNIDKINDVANQINIINEHFNNLANEVQPLKDECFRE